MTSTKIILLTLCLLGFASTAEAKVKPLAPDATRQPISENKRQQQIYYFHEGKQQAIVGNLQGALFCYNKALAKDPYCDACYYEMATVCVNLNNLPDALVAAKNAYILDSTNLWYALFCAKLLATTRQYDEAAALYWRCLQQKPKQREVYQDLLMLYDQQNDYESAISLLDTYEQNLGQDETSLLTKQNLFYRSGQFEKSAEQVGKLLEMFPDNQKYYLLASELQLQQGNDSLSWQLLQQARDIDSLHIDYLLTAASFHYRRALFSDYFVVLTQLFELPPTTLESKLQVLDYLRQQAPAFIQLYADEIFYLYQQLPIDSFVANSRICFLYAVFLLQTGKQSLATAALSQFLQGAHNNPSAVSAREKAMITSISQLYMSVWLERQQWDSVIVTAQQYLNFFENPTHVQHLKIMALCQKHEYAKAQQEAEALLPGIPLNDSSFVSQFYATLGDIYFQNAIYNKGDRCYEKALKYTPNNVLLFNNYAYYLSLRQKKLGKALKMSELALAQDPDNATYLDTYAWILYQQKRYQEAKQIFRKAFVYGGEKEFTILEHYGDVLFQLGEKDNAMIYWKRSMNNGNTSETLQKKINNVKF